MNIKHRDDFGYWLNGNGLLGVGVEVGVWRGDYSARILSTWRGQKLFGIDPYSLDCQAADDPLAIAQSDFDVAKAAMWNATAGFGNQFEMIYQPSRTASMRFDMESLDFVYIDGNHSNARKDIEDWFPLVKQGGVLAGHDYTDDPNAPWLLNVKRAVDALFSSVHISEDSSWWIVK